jgi:hypothetical protein
MPKNWGVSLLVLALIFSAGFIIGANSLTGSRIVRGILVNREVKCAGVVCVGYDEKLADVRIGQSVDELGGVWSIVCGAGPDSELIVFPEMRYKSCDKQSYKILLTDRTIATTFTIENRRLTHIMRQPIGMLEF